MERIPNIDQERVDYWRQYNVDGAAVRHEDDDLPPEERRDRADVLPGSVLKRDDDVIIAEVIPMRVIGPARGGNVIFGYYPDWFGDDAIGFEITPTTIITDRAPFDTEEDPMPIFPEAP